MYIETIEMPVYMDPESGTIRWDVDDKSGEDVTHIITLTVPRGRGEALTLEMETISYDQDAQDWLTVGRTRSIDVITRVVDPATLYRIKK